MECIKIVAVGLFILFNMLHYTASQPGGSVLVRLNHLQNPENINHAGGCCSKRVLGRCQSCDYKISLWVTCDARTTKSECLYGEGTTRVFYNKSEIFFLQHLGNGFSNPLVSNFTSFQGNLGIKILATNVSGSEIHSYSFHKSVHPTTYDKKKWVNTTLYANRNSNITLSYNIHCNKHYYSPSCSVGCLPGANYKCDENTGKKLCINGYIGPNCTCKPSHKHNCNVATGKKICYQSWFGLNCDVKCQGRNNSQSGYSCDRNTGAKICLSGWYGPECTNTIPIPQVSSSTIFPQKISPTLVASSFQSTLTKNSVNHRTSLVKKIISSPSITANTMLTSSSQMSIMSSLTSSPKAFQSSTTSTVVSSLVTPLPITSLTTSSPMTSSLMTSSPKAFQSSTTSTVMSSLVMPLLITSLMTSSPMTSSLMTSLPTTSHLLPSQAYSVFTDGGSSHLKRAYASMIRNSTRQTGSAKTFATIITSSRIKVNSPSLYNGFITITKKPLARTPTNVIATSESKRHQTTRVVTSQTADQEKTKNKPKTDSSSACFDVTNTLTPRVTTFKPELKDASRGEDLWWLFILPLIVAILLTITVIAMFKKNRKRREITPHYETSMQQFDVKPKEIRKSNKPHDKQRKSDKDINDNQEPCQDDLEAIWKVMSTCHV